MEEMIAYCGLLCHQCPARKATLNNDEELLNATAAEWSKLYGAELTAESIKCIGCTSDVGPQIGHCAECEVRLCARKHQVNTCADCPQYPCKIILKFQEMVPSAKITLDALVK